jgi:hypothetical protein
MNRPGQVGECYRRRALRPLRRPGKPAKAVISEGYSGQLHRGRSRGNEPACLSSGFLMELDATAGALRCASFIFSAARHATHGRGSAMTVGADRLRTLTRRTSVPNATSSPGASRVGEEMRMPLTRVPFVLPRSSIVALPETTVIRACRRDAVVASMTSEHSTSRPAMCSPSVRGSACFRQTSSIVAGCASVGGVQVTLAQNAYPVL